MTTRGTACADRIFSNVKNIKIASKVSTYLSNRPNFLEGGCGGCSCCGQGASAKSGGDFGYNGAKSVHVEALARLQNAKNLLVVICDRSDPSHARPQFTMFLFRDIPSVAGVIELYIGNAGLGPGDTARLTPRLGVALPGRAGGTGTAGGVSLSARVARSGMADSNAVARRRGWPSGVVR